ncbi:hypothetical protein NDN01_07100 [Sphingomonas sp. QA11]|uniref:hypothetical protein n=1 Tax=Sphingomonas sp. QA11 TaxID=2950605 RepID=UPI00234982B3|nr:hypothetical protein [Sphingomonas sp. QA11]WCM28671.1 hypothetical protein NDN01_07100 [Sphingomonas sp. QA11]
MSICFEKSQDAWFAQGGKYEMHREGRRVGQRFTLLVNGQREASFFAWPEQAPGSGGPEYTWTLGVSHKTAETAVGFETYASLFTSFLKAYQNTTGLPLGSVNIAFDPDIERKALDQWGP